MLYLFGDYTLDTQGYALCCAGTPVHVRPKVFEVLAYLLAHRDRVVPKPELLAHVWPGQAVSDETLDSCLALARRAVGDSARVQGVIQTRHGYGHRFVAAVEVRRHPPLLDDVPPAPSTTRAPLEPAPEPGRAVAPRPEAAHSSVPAPPDALTPPHPRPLAGEQKLVTVLVCTLAQAAALAQRLEAEAWHQTMQAFVASCLEEVERYGGTLQRLLDDGILALFGAPVAQEDHARRAVRAALALQQGPAARRLDPAWPPGEVGAVCMGLHTGRILLGRLGDDLRLTFTAVGDTTQRAAGLAQQAAPGAILVSAATARLVHGEVRLEACVSVPLPGQTDSGTVYQVLGLGPHRAPRLTAGARPRSRFVGRELELTTLRALLTRVTEGQGQVVGIVGEPGMGKTRLLTEFRQRLGDMRVTWLEGRCVSYGQATPYGPIQDLLRHACGCTEADRPAALIPNVQQYLQALGLAPAEAAPLLLHLLGVPGGAARLVERSPQEIRSQTFATLHQVLRQESQRQPLLLVVENLHWIDPTSQEFLTEVVERLPSVPLLLLVTFRPGYRPPWMEKSYATQLALPRLSPEDSRGVMQAVLHPAPVPEPLLQHLLAKAAGNPLFLEELAWTVREHGDLHLPLEVPATIQAVLAARIDQLPPDAKQVLQTAAVIGTEVPVPLLQAITELTEATLHRGLAHLHAAEFLYETRLFPAHEYTFKHALTQEVAYGSLLQQERRALHARIVEVLEALAGDRLAEQVAHLAQHAFQGQVWAKALRYSQQAGAQALAGSAYQEGVVCLEQALEALAHLPTDRATLEQAVDLRCDLYYVLQPLAQWTQALTHLHEAETIAEELGDQRRLVILYRCLANTLRGGMQDYEPALAYCQRAHAIATALGEVELQLEINLARGFIYTDLGAYRQAMAYLQQTLTALQGERRSQAFGLVRRSIIACTWMVRCLSELGEFAVGAAYGDEARQIAEAVDRPYERLAVYSCVGHLHVRQGTLHQAIPLLERAVALGQDTNILAHCGVAAAWLALAYALAGRAADVLPLLGQLEKNAVVCGEAYLRAGDVDAAHRLAERTLTAARHRKMRGQEARALWLLGEIAIRRDPLDVTPAAAHYQQALTLAEALGMRPLVAHCHHGLGMLYATMGRREQAQAALRSAIELFRVLEMAFWLPEAEAALAQVARGPQP